MKARVLNPRAFVGSASDNAPAVVSHRQLCLSWAPIDVGEARIVPKKSVVTAPNGDPPLLTAHRLLLLSRQPPCPMGPSSSVNPRVAASKEDEPVSRR